MCNPTTLLIAATALQAGGSLIGGINANKAAKGRAKMSEGNAGTAEQNALTSRNVGAVNVSRSARLTQAKVAEARTTFAKGGVEVNTGTPMEVQVAEAVNGGVLAMTEKFKADEQARGFEVQATNFHNEAAAFRAAGKNAMVAGVINAAAAVAAGAFVGSALLPATTGATSVAAVSGPTGAVQQGLGSSLLVGVP